MPLAMRTRDVMISPIVAWDHADELVEEYSGFAVRAESRRLGSDRLGVFFEWSTYNADWRDQTLDALALNPQMPGAYGNRMSVTPLLKFAFTPEISVAGGVGITELDPLDDDIGQSSRMANVVIGSVRFHRQWDESSRPTHEAGAAFTVRAATTALESDFEYERYLIEADYRFRLGRHSIVVSGMGGGISGTAPLFERFTLGDTKTLRGWSKYEIAPLGGDRMFHLSGEYRIHDLQLFLDAGSVWEAGTQKRARFSTGVGYAPGPFFVSLGFPINTDEFHAAFAMGFRFGLSSTGVRKF
jgi:outer membrane translocation and assembly module TamA